MKKKLLFTCFFVLLLALALTACGTKTTEKNGTENDVDQNMVTATGTLVGFADNHTVEITMEDGTSQTFLVFDEDVAAKLEEYANAGQQEITFTYGPRDGQELEEIMSVE